jgi:hypothetical protein
VLSGFGPKGRWHRVYDRHGGRGKDLLLDGAKFELVYAGFLGERAAALPGPTYRDSDVPGLGVAPGLFTEVDGVLERGPDIPAGQGDITQTGFVKLGDGADLAIHAGRIGEWKGDGFAFTFKDELKPNYTSPSLCAIPYGDDGFITLARRKIVHVRRGKPIKTLFASKNTRVFPRMLMAGGRDWIAVSLESNALHRFDIVKKTMTRIDTTSLTEGGFDPSWYPPVAVAPCGIVAVVDQGFALARAGKRG